MNYLLSTSAYEDRYDRFVVDRCRRSVQIHKEVVDGIKETGSKDPVVHRQVSDLTHELMMYFLKGDLWKDRRETIDRWIADDKKRDEIFENASTPTNVRCGTCSKQMGHDIKTPDQRRGEDHVLFFFYCTSKHRGRAIYEDGEEWEPREVHCDKCNGVMQKEKETRKNNIIRTKYQCTKCNHVDVSELDMNRPEPEEDLHYEEDKKLYCISDEEGRGYLQHIEGMKRVSNLLKEQKEKDQNKALYQLIDSIENLTIPQLEKRITTALEDSQFVRLTLEKPEVGRDVVVPFIIYDVSEREARTSGIALQKILKKALVKTNWAPFAEAPSYRMGMLSGSLRGVESEDAIKMLVEKRLKAKELKLPKVEDVKKDDEPGIIYTEDGTKVRL